MRSHDVICRPRTRARRNSPERQTAAAGLAQLRERRPRPHIARRECNFRDKTREFEGYGGAVQKKRVILFICAVDARSGRYSRRY